MRRKLVFSAVAVTMVFLGIEMVLRFAHLGDPPSVGVLRFGYESGIPLFDSDGIEQEGQPFRDFPIFEADSRLFWKPIANTPFTGADGLRLKSPTTKVKDKKVIRIGVIGDSCSFLGKDLYPNQLAKQLEVSSGKSVEVVNASCPGYTSEQGARRLQDLWQWEPDVVLVYFGWNDHWKSLNGQTDRQLLQRQQLSEEAQSWLGMSRIVWSLYSLRAMMTPPVSLERAPVRVPLDDYQENLRSIFLECEQNECPVLCITAPSAFLKGQLPTWAYQFFGEIYGMTQQEVSAIPMTHQDYNEVVRRLCEDNEIAYLADVAANWLSSADWEDRLPERFRGDRIHLTEIGHRDVAIICHEVLEPIFGQ